MQSAADQLQYNIKPPALCRTLYKGKTVQFVEMLKVRIRNQTKQYKTQPNYNNNTHSIHEIYFYVFIYEV